MLTWVQIKLVIALVCISWESYHLVYTGDEVLLRWCTITLLTIQVIFCIIEIIVSKIKETYGKKEI